MMMVTRRSEREQGGYQEDPAPLFQSSTNSGEQESLGTDEQQSSQASGSGTVKGKQAPSGLRHLPSGSDFLTISQLLRYLLRIKFFQSAEEALAADQAAQATEQQGDEETTALNQTTLHALSLLPKPTLDTLSRIHAGHALNIPFENLSLAHPRYINSNTVDGPVRAPRIDLQSLYDKLVRQRRGGWCFEMNPLFTAALRTLGFYCYMGTARVVILKPDPEEKGLAPANGENGDNLAQRRREKLDTPSFPTSENPGDLLELTSSTHQIVFVRLQEDNVEGPTSKEHEKQAPLPTPESRLTKGQLYLCDVGFGRHGALVRPLPLRAFDEVFSFSSPVLPPNSPSSACWRLRRGLIGSADGLAATDVNAHPERESHVGWYFQSLLYKKSKRSYEWCDQYYFTTQTTTVADSVMANFYTAAQHPLFTEHVVLTMPTDDVGGRISLLDYTLKTHQGYSGARKTASSSAQAEADDAPPTVVEKLLKSEADRDKVLEKYFGLGPLDT